VSVAHRVDSGKLRRALANALLAASTSLRLSLLSSGCASEMSLRSVLIASTLCVTASFVTVAAVTRVIRDGARRSDRALTTNDNEQ
jgi:hypothetical protein